MSDMYHKILNWIETDKPDHLYPCIAPAVQEWLQRADDGDETNDLVEEFVYGSRCAVIRQQFGDE